MILSLFKLNRNDCKNLRITDKYSIHRIIYDLFPGEKREFLFADKGGDWNSKKIIILSNEIPNVPQYGQIQSKSIPDSFFNYLDYAFEITLNPTKRDFRTKKITAIKGNENLRAWLINKSKIHGFEINENELEVSHIGVEQFKNKNGGICTYNSVNFKGKLKVTNKNEFIKTFEKGIGRAKGFGFGLLQIVPLKNN